MQVAALLAARQFRQQVCDVELSGTTDLTGDREGWMHGWDHASSGELGQSTPLQPRGVLSGWQHPGGYGTQRARYGRDEARLRVTGQLHRLVTSGGRSPAAPTPTAGRCDPQWYARPDMGLGGRPTADRWLGLVDQMREPSPQEHTDDSS